MATRGENSELLVSLTLQDNLSGPMKAAKANVDAAAQSVERIDQKIGNARTGIARFASAGSQLALVGSTIGGSFGAATGPLSDFIRVGGNLGLVGATIADLVPVAGAATGAITGLAASLAVVALPLTVVAVGIGAFAVAAQRTVTPLERAQTATQVASTRVAILDRALAAGQLTAEAYAQRIALITPASEGAASATDDLVGSFGPLDTILEAISKSLQIMNAEIDKSGIGIVTVTGTQKDLADAAETARLRLLGEAAGFTGVEAAAKNASSALATTTSQTYALITALSQLPIGVGAGATGVDQSGGNVGAPGNAPTDTANLPGLPVVASTPAVTKAKSDATDLANIYKDRVQVAFDAAKRTADTLFDALHRRNLQAIDDAEKLAQTRHDNTAQAIADQLKLEQASHAAPVLAAQQALNDRQAIQQRRDLVEAQQAAAQELARNTDPANTQGLARALRAATEALQNFDASATIGRLQEIQQQQDAASEQRARVAAGINDAELAAAKQAADIARDAETIADQKRRQRFDLELAALQKRDEALKKSPAAIQKDIEALQAKFGITIDPITGFHHITDPLVAAIKNVKIEPPKVTVNNNQTFKLILGPNELRLIASSIEATKQPQATASSRTGNARG